MKEAELTLNPLSAPVPGLRRSRLVRIAVPVALGAAIALLAHHGSSDAEQSAFPPRMAASFVEVQSTYLLFAIETGASAPDFCERAGSALERAQLLAGQTRANGVVHGKAAELVSRLASLKLDCARPSAGMIEPLARSRQLARELSASLGTTIGAADLGPEARQPMSPAAVPNAPVAPASRRI